MSDQTVLHISDLEFLSTIKEAGKPVLLDFYADWCGPCQVVAPILEELASEYQGKILIAKMNIDENRQTPSEYGVISIPTVVVLAYEDDQVVLKAKQVGFAGKEGLVAIIEKALE